MSDELTRALVRDYPADELEALLARAVRVGLDFATGRHRDGLVLQHASVRELSQRFAADLPSSGLSDEDLLSALGEVAAWSIAQADPRYLAFPDTGDSIAGVMAEVVSTLLNQNLIAFDRSAPAGSVIEAQLIGWLRELVGFKTIPMTSNPSLSDLGGMWTSGGNMSNHVAIAAALASRYPDVHRTGLAGLPERPVIVLARGVEHFSYLGAAQILGLGSQSLLWAGSTAEYTSDIVSMEQILANPPPGTRVLMVVGVAGNCRTTGIDELQALADLCDRHGAWFHVDACHGGSLLFSEQLRGLVAGIERADSVSLDPHKGLFTTYPSSYVLFRETASLATFARYPAKVGDPDCLDLGLVTPFYGSRGFESLKLWAFIRHQGRSGIARLVEARQETFQQLKALLERTGFFRVIGSSDFYRCAFVFCPAPASQKLADLARDAGAHDQAAAVISSYSTQFCERLYRSGEVVFDLFGLQDLGNSLGLGRARKYQVMGMCVGHPHIDPGVQDEIEKSINRVAQELVEPMVEALQDIGPAAPQQPAEDAVQGPAGW